LLKQKICSTCSHLFYAELRTKVQQIIGCLAGLISGKAGQHMQRRPCTES